MPFARRDCDDVGQPVRDVALAAVIGTGSASPRHDGAVVLDRDAVIDAGSDRRYVRQAVGDIALAEVVGVAAPPHDDGSITLQRHAVVVAGGDPRHVREPLGNVALSGIVRSATPGDDRAVGFQRETLNPSRGDGDYGAGQARRHVALTPVRVAAAAPGHDPFGLYRLRRARRQEQPDDQDTQDAEPDPRPRRQVDFPLPSSTRVVRALSRAIATMRWERRPWETIVLPFKPDYKQAYRPRDVAVGGRLCRCPCEMPRYSDALVESGHSSGAPTAAISSRMIRRRVSSKPPSERVKSTMPLGLLPYNPGRNRWPAVDTVLWC